jgi:hypothetical protein
LDKIVRFATLDFGGAYLAFRLLITCAVRRYGFSLRVTLLHDIYQPYLSTAHRVVRTAVFRILGVFYDVQTIDQLNCAKRKCSLPTEFGGLNVQSFELDIEHAHYASFTATLANMNTDNAPESLGPMTYVRSYPQGTIAFSSALRTSYDTISNMGGFWESDLAALTYTLNQDMSEFPCPDVELVVSPVDNSAASATQFTCFILPTPDALTRSGDFGGPGLP